MVHFGQVVSSQAVCHRQEIARSTTPGSASPEDFSPSSQGARSADPVSDRHIKQKAVCLQVGTLWHVPIKRLHIRCKLLSWARDGN
jgi:hypothetical protein